MRCRFIFMDPAPWDCVEDGQTPGRFVHRSKHLGGLRARAKRIPTRCSGTIPCAKSHRSSALFMVSFRQMKALPVQELPKGDWRYEIKYDGYRALSPNTARMWLNLTRSKGVQPGLLDRLKSLFPPGLHEEQFPPWPFTVGS